MALLMYQAGAFLILIYRGDGGRERGSYMATVTGSLTYIPKKQRAKREESLGG